MNASTHRVAAAGAFARASLNAGSSAPPPSRNRRTYWLTLAGGPICSRAPSQPFETDVVAFIAAANRTFGFADFRAGS